MSEQNPVNEKLQQECMALCVMHSIAMHLGIAEEDPIRSELLKALYAKQEQIVSGGDLVRPTLPGVLQVVANGLSSAYSSSCQTLAKADIHIYPITTVKMVEDGTMEARCKAPLLTEGNPVFAVSGDRTDSPGRPTKFIPEELSNV